MTDTIMSKSLNVFYRTLRDFDIRIYSQIKLVIAMEPRLQTLLNT